MKRLNIYICFVLFLSLLSVNAQNTYEVATEAFRNQDYKKSIQLFEQLVAQNISENKESPQVYYNLGNAYFRNGQVARAILNYERALLLDPKDRDTRHNLKFARTRIEDKIDASDRFFLNNWIAGIKNIFNANSWAVASIVIFFLFLAFIGIFLFVRLLWLRKTGFYAAIVAFLLLLMTNYFAFNQKNKQINRNTAIVMAASASIMSSPDGNSQELFRLHEGTKLKVNKTDGNWIEIEIANGSVGWTSKENVEII